ncbi:hypothetical protein BC940DRAFT_106836 [Gongronella butleri]|nr:hypothetical protein BC940DRAFT_106836 [Gongronella butleri]
MMCFPPLLEAKAGRFPVVSFAFYFLFFGETHRSTLVSFCSSLRIFFFFFWEQIGFFVDPS